MTEPRIEALRIAGRKVGADRTGSRVIEVRNPYTRELVGTVPKITLDELRQVFVDARAYRATLSRFERSLILNRAAASVRSRTQEIAELITAESGLCMKDSSYEAGRVADVLMFGAIECLKDDAQTFSCDITPHGRKRRVYTQRDPLLGVISAITPFNHPMNQVAHKIVPSVATNNRMVLKPSEKVPLSALLLADILYEAGLPGPMLSIVTGDPAEIADELLTNPNVDLITFTGGVPIGKYIAAKAGYRRVVLELGGNDPIIVMEDADLEEAATLAVSGSYKNSGQRCTAVKRLLVHEKVAGDFTERVVAKTKAWSFGDPSNPKVEMGTVIDEAAAKLFEARVKEACEQGARLLVGGRREGALFAPTVLDNVRREMTVVREETFGPVSPILTFANIDEAVALSNGTAYGLSSAVCTNRMDYITRFVTDLHVGTVNVREVPVALATPSLAISCAAREALHQADVVETMLRGILPVIRHNELAASERLRKMDDTVDELYSAIKFYLTQINRETLSDREGRRWADVMSFTINMEQIGDIIERVLQDVEDKKIHKGHSFSDAGMAEICHLHERLLANLRLGMSVFLDGHVRDAQKLLEEKARFRDLEREYAASHIARLQDNTAQSIETSRAVHLGGKHHGGERVRHAFGVADAVDHFVHLFHGVHLQHGAQVVAATDRIQLGHLMAPGKVLDDIGLGVGFRGNQHQRLNAGLHLPRQAHGVAGDGAAVFQRLQPQLHGAARHAKGAGQLHHGQARVHFQQRDQTAALRCPEMPCNA
ncbi:hypothetical protein B566_EDAN018544 [Ephemera danica]|nr:hypothetical protein B566_EDAN018544 [Ephemera danica]